MDETSLNLKKKIELVAICKEKKLPVSGNKKDLVARILKASKQATLSANGTLKAKCTRKLCATICLERNRHGNFEHVETGFVFHPESKKIIGKQAQDGSVILLTAKDVIECNNWKFDVDATKISYTNSDNTEERLKELLAYYKEEKEVDAESSDEETT